MFKISKLARNTARIARQFFAGNLEIFGGPSLPDAIGGRIRAEQVSTVTRYTRPMMVGVSANACVLLLALWHSELQATVTVWSFFLISAAVFVYLKRRASETRPKPNSLSDRVIKIAILNAAIMGVIWALMPILFFDGAGNDGKLIIVTLCIGMLCGGAFCLAPIPAAAFAFLTPLAFGAGYSIVRLTEPVYFLIVGLLVVYTFVLMRGVVTHACQTTKNAIEHALSDVAAHTDSLTKLPNRVAFLEQLDAGLAQVKRYGDGFSLFYFDLDEFKLINDRFGHSGGDELLRLAAERLLSCTREGDTLARLSGDEFALIAAKAGKPEQAMVVAERILKAFSAPFAVGGRQIYSKVSMGIALVPVDGNESGVILEKADAALYTTKRNGKASYCFFAKEHDEKVRERRLLEQHLRLAIRNNELHLAFQPIIKIETGNVCGFEALVRWKSLDQDDVSPAVFIPIAEEIGVIQELGEWVIREAVRIASTWPHHLSLAINISAIQLRTSSLLTVLHDVLAENSFSPSRIEIEITESTIVAESESAIALLNTLRQWGIRVALDDFGTGYSSLRYLIDLPIDKVKIDRSFVATITTRATSRSLVKAVIALARDLNMAVTAEGIETEEQLSFLKSCLCDEGQGYLISQPRVEADLGELILPNSAIPGLRLAS